MTECFIGVDLGTQGAKAVLVDGESGELIASAVAHYDFISSLEPGCKEQHPSDWVRAVDEVIESVLNATTVDRDCVRAIGVSGQQHGLVTLDQHGEVIRPAKLWCDTSTAVEAEEIVNNLGGLKKTIELTGNGVPAGFTASKILWMKRHEPENYGRVATVLLPHDYINFYLTGRRAMEPGDASGTGLFDVRARRWSDVAIAAVDTTLKDKLPPLIDSNAALGTLRTELGQRWHLGPDVIVSAGSGDNMMSAVGTGNVTEGVVTASLGTSGTIYACSEHPIIDPKGEVAAFCDGTGKWLPLICTMNVTMVTEMVRKQFNWSYEQFDAAAGEIAPGADGLLLIPYLEGERVPNRPEATGVLFGIRQVTFDGPHIARATLEGVTMGLDYGLTRLREMGLEPKEVRLTGGGAKSALWRQIMADVFGVSVVRIDGESAALGAALHAMWVYRNRKIEQTEIESITERFVRVDERTRVEPDNVRARIYSDLKRLFARLATRREDFIAHRQFILKEH